MGVLVVGVDGSAGSRDALRWAVDEARLRDDVVRAVLVFQYAPVGWAFAVEGIPAPALPYEEFEQEATKALATTVGEVAGDVDDVTIEQVVVEGPAAQSLIDAAQDAELLVIGSRGFGGFRGLLLGSVSQQCVHHATCPVVVLPHHE